MQMHRIRSFARPHAFLSTSDSLKSHTTSGWLPPLFLRLLLTASVKVYVSYNYRFSITRTCYLLQGTESVLPLTAAVEARCCTCRLWLARLADEKRKFSTEILQEKDVNKLSLWHWISRPSLTWLEMPFQVRLTKQEAIVPRTFHWTLPVPSMNNIGMQSTFSNHNSIRDELGFIYSASASASNNYRGM